MGALIVSLRVAARGWAKRACIEQGSLQFTNPWDAHGLMASFRDVGATDFHFPLFPFSPSPVQRVHVHNRPSPVTGAD